MSCVGRKRSRSGAIMRRRNLQRLLRCCLVGALVISLRLGVCSIGQCDEPNEPFVATDKSLPLRVLSYNIHHGEGSDGKVDLQRIARVINDAHPDLVALQEVDSGTKRTHGVDQPRQLADLTKLHGAFGDNIPFEGGRYGNAVLSRFPIVRQKNHPLPSHYKGEQRGVLEVEVQLPDKRPPLVFYATHFDYRGDYDGERIESARRVNQLLSRQPQAAAILAGDLNAEPKSKPLEELSKKWNRGERFAPTYPADAPTGQIDYILFRPASRWRVIETRVIDEAVASDHRPLLTVLELQPSAE